MYEIWHYLTASGRNVFDDWLGSLKDKDAEGQIAVRLNRLKAGNFGDCRSVGGGVWELRIDYGPGYRVYYAISGKTVVLLLCGGDKRTQSGDMARAKAFWADYRGKDEEIMKRKASISHEEVMVKKLRNDAKFAAAYLKAAMEDSEEPQVLLIALRQVAKARGIANVAKRAKIERESLYRALSPKGNPRFSTIAAVTKALGLTLTVEPAPSH